MNILLLATSDEQGAGIAAANITEAFRKGGHNSILIVKESELKNKNVIVLTRPPARYSVRYFIGKFKHKLRRLKEILDPLDRQLKYFFHNLNERKTHIRPGHIIKNLPFKPDVIIPLWISNFVNAKTINTLHKKTGAKIIWIMTDNAPFTGGCHYPWDCKGFHTDCSDCPALITPSKKKIAKKNLAFKKKHLPAGLELVPGSESDYRRSLNASLFKGRKIHKLLLPVDDVKFKRGNKAEAKRHFGIEPQKKTLFYGVQSFTDPRKGARYFIDAIQSFKKKLKEEGINENNFLIMLAGHDNIDFSGLIDIPFKQLGFLNEENLVRAFQAADVFVCTSVEDSGPLMINQSIMCGTPVVAFEMGVALDLVQTAKTGYLVKLFDTEDMGKGIDQVLRLPEPELEQLCKNCRAFAEDTITMHKYTNDLLQLIRN